MTVEGAESGVKPGQNPGAIKDYEERRQKLAERLQPAAENITYCDAERKRIQTLQLAQGEYIAWRTRSGDSEPKNLWHLFQH